MGLLKPFLLYSEPIIQLASDHFAPTSWSGAQSGAANPVSMPATGTFDRPVSP